MLANASLVSVDVATKQERRLCRERLKRSRKWVKSFPRALPAIKREAVQVIERNCGACGLCSGI